METAGMKLTEIIWRAKNLSILSLSVLVLSSCAGQTGSSDNRLNVEYGTKAPGSVDVTRQLAGMMNYNGKTVEELMALRTRNAGLFPDLLQGEYKPSPGVFQIDSKTPWWSLRGYLFRANDLSPTEGLSRESPFFGNPYLLVAPELYGTRMHWSDHRFATAKLFADVFPLYQQPASVKIFPKEKREEIVYNLLNYYNNIKAQLDEAWAISDIAFDLNGYNAEDFGYNYLYVEPSGSSNLAKLPAEVIKIDQTLMVKHKGTCAPACNDIDSPDAMKAFSLKSVPARCRLLLWRNKPTSYLAPHDFTVDLIFN
jgi:hypothetical protein